jgi:RimJ/RimL family protein N-acetyltransferase
MQSHNTPLTPTTLTAHGLHLAPWQEQAASTFRLGLNDPEVRRWDGMSDPLQDDEAALARIRSRAEGWLRGDLAAFCITDAATGEILGSAELHRIEPRRRSGGIGYWLLPTARGRGVATRAVDLCTRWAFETLGLHRIELGHATANDPSCRVALRTGYAAEGVARDAMPLPAPGEYADMHIHARLATDPAPDIRQQP